jgi:hypothetical protein
MTPVVTSELVKNPKGPKFLGTDDDSFQNGKIRA